MAGFPQDWLIQLDTMQEEMVRLLDRFTGPRVPLVRFPPPAWQPAIDIYETDEEVVLVVELAGVKEEDIEIVVSRNEFVIRGERKATAPAGGPSYYQMEINSGSFERRIVLPRAVDPRETKASYQDGLVRVTLPKAREERIRRFQVRAV